MSNEVLQLTREVGEIKGKMDGMGEQVKDIKDENVRIWQQLDENGKTLNQVAAGVKSIDDRLGEHITTSSEELKRVKSDVVRVKRTTEVVEQETVESWLSGIAKQGIGRVIEYGIVAAILGGIYWALTASQEAEPKDKKPAMTAPPIEVSP